MRLITNITSVPWTWDTVHSWQTLPDDFNLPILELWQPNRGLYVYLPVQCFLSENGPHGYWLHPLIDFSSFSSSSFFSSFSSSSSSPLFLHTLSPNYIHGLVVRFRTVQSLVLYVWYCIWMLAVLGENASAAPLTWLVSLLKWIGAEELSWLFGGVWLHDCEVSHCLLLHRLAVPLLS